jgi:hypothetical protein
MGARAVILVTGSHWQGRDIAQTVRLYRHHDGVTAPLVAAYQ